MKYTTCIILMMFILWEKLLAQETNAIKPQPNNKLVLQKEFINKIDSLFTHQQYTAIIEVCNTDQPHYNRQAADYNLIAAYYFMGAKEKALALLENLLKRHSTVFSMTDVLKGDYTSYRAFLAIQTNKDFVLDHIYSKFSEENVQDIDNAKIILKLVLDDQLTRHNSKMYTKVKSQTRFPYQYLLDDSISNEKMNQTKLDVFAFYKQTGKIFSKEEVGSIYNDQFILFLHDNNLERRAYYLKLIQKAVKDKYIIIKREIDFQILTELYTKEGDVNIFNAPEELVDKYRKLYHMPDYNYFPF